ncbi:MAG: hypothetical protein VXZ73_02655, partial [Pseudomonadota bacterium]|nr:hypothetical protein [Pseudomonadota bacterium]
MSIKHYQNLFALLTGSRLVSGTSEIIAGKTEETLAFYQSSLTSYGFFLVTLGFLWPSFAIFSIVTNPTWLLAMQLPNVFLYYELVTRRFSTRENNNATQKNKLLDPLELSNVKKGAVDGSTKKRLAQQAWLYAFLGIISFESVFNDIFINFNRGFAKIVFAPGHENSFTEQETLPDMGFSKDMPVPNITTLSKMLFKIGLSNKRYGEKIARIAFLIWPSLRTILQLFFRTLLFVVDRFCLCLDFFHFYRISTAVMKNIPWISILFIGANLTYNLVVLGSVTMPLCLALCAFVLIILQHLAFLDHFASRQMYHIQRIARFVEPLFIGNILSKFFILFSSISSLASQMRNFLLKFDTYIFSFDVEKSLLCRYCIRVLALMAYTKMKLLSFIPPYNLLKVSISDMEEDLRRQYKDRASMKQDAAIRRSGDISKKPFRVQPSENRVPVGAFPELYGKFVDNYINFPIVMANAAPFSTELPINVTSYYSPLISFTPHSCEKIRRPATATGLVIPDHLKLSYPLSASHLTEEPMQLEDVSEWYAFLDSIVEVDGCREMFAKYVERDQPQLAVLLRDSSKEVRHYFNLDDRLNNLKSKSMDAYTHAKANWDTLRSSILSVYRRYDLRDILVTVPENFASSQHNIVRQNMRDLLVYTLKDLLDNYAKCDQAMSTSLKGLVQEWDISSKSDAFLKSFLSMRKVRDDMSAQVLAEFFAHNRVIAMVNHSMQFMDIGVAQGAWSRFYCPMKSSRSSETETQFFRKENDLCKILSHTRGQRQTQGLIIPAELAAMEFMPASRSAFFVLFNYYTWQTYFFNILFNVNEKFPNLDETNRHTDRAARLLLGIAEDVDSDVTQVETDALGNDLANLSWLNVSTIQNNSPLGVRLVDSIVPKSKAVRQSETGIPTSMFEDSFLQLPVASNACPLYQKFTDYLSSEGYPIVKSENPDEKNAAMVALLEKQMDFKTSPLRVLAIHQFLKEKQVCEIAGSIKTFFAMDTSTLVKDGAMLVCNKIFLNLKNLNRCISSEYSFPNSDVLFIKEQYTHLPDSSGEWDSKKWDDLTKDTEVVAVLRSASFILFLKGLASELAMPQDGLITSFKDVVESCFNESKENIKRKSQHLHDTIQQLFTTDAFLSLVKISISNVHTIIEKQASKKVNVHTWKNVACIVQAMESNAKSLLICDTSGSQIALSQEDFDAINGATGTIAHDIFRSPKIHLQGSSGSYIHHLFEVVLQDLGTDDVDKLYRLRAFLSPSSRDDVISVVNHYFMPLQPGQIPTDQVNHILACLAKGKRPSWHGCRDHHFSSQLISKWMDMQIDRASKAIILPPALMLMLKEGIIYRAANYHDSNPANIYQDVVEEERHANDRLFPPENSPKISAPKQSKAHILTLLARGFWKSLCFALGSTPSLFKKLLQMCYLLPIYVLNLVGSLLLTPWLMAKKFYHVHFTNPLRVDTWDSVLFKKYACLDNRLARLLLVPILSVITLFDIVLGSLNAFVSYGVSMY